MLPAYDLMAGDSSQQLFLLYRVFHPGEFLRQIQVVPAYDGILDEVSVHGINAGVPV